MGREAARIRREKGLTLDNVAERSGLSRKSVVNVEQAHKAPDIATLHALAHGLGVPLAALVTPLCADHRDGPA